MDVENEVIPTLNTAQRASREIFYFANTVWPVALVAGEIPYQGTWMGLTLTSLAVSAGMKMHAFVDDLLCRRDTLAPLRVQGDGVASTGVQRAAATFAISTALPMMLCAVAGGLYQITVDRASFAVGPLLEPASGSVLQYLMDTAFIRVPVVGLVSWGVYCLAEQGVYVARGVTAPVVAEEDDPALHPVQWILKNLVKHPLQAVIMVAGLRQILITAGQQTAFPATLLSFLVTPLHEFLQLWRQSFVLHPLRSLADERERRMEQQMEQQLRLDAELDSLLDEQPLPVKRALPVSADVFYEVGCYSLRTAMTLTAGFLMALMLKSAQGDDENVSLQMLLLQWSVVALTSALVEQGLERLPSLVACGAAFFSQKPAVSRRASVQSYGSIEQVVNDDSHSMLHSAFY